MQNKTACKQAVIADSVIAGDLNYIIFQASLFKCGLIAQCALLLKCDLIF